MKKLYFILIAVLLFNTVEAQTEGITDADAKLEYQKAEDAYNSTDYYTAVMIVENVQGRMNKWTPKTLYLFLKSIYKNFTEINQTSQHSFKKDDYQQYSLYADWCHDFFKMVDKATYPADKYKEIQDIQAYFKQKMEQFAYQKDRTPEKAIAFLNQCAVKFPYPEIGDPADGETHQTSIFLHSINYTQNMGNYINFKIDSNYLYIRSITKDVSTSKKKWYVVYFIYDVIDLRHTPSFDNGTVNNGDIYFYRRHCNNVDAKKFTARDQDTLSYQIQHKNDGDFFTGYIPYKDNAEALNISEKHTFSFRENELVIQYPILDFFDTQNKEFIDGGYGQRIKEAFKYIIDYYPKQKQQQKSAGRDNGF